jgi:hypothetical protein
MDGRIETAVARVHYLVLVGSEPAQAFQEQLAARHVFHQGKHAGLPDASEGGCQGLDLLRLPGYSVHQPLEDAGPGQKETPIHSDRSASK